MKELRIDGISDALCGYIEKMKIVCSECGGQMKSCSNRSCKISVTDQQLVDILNHLQKVDGNARLGYNSVSVVVGDVENMADVVKESSSFIINL